MINRNSQVPLYIQLADTLREKIKTGEIKKGDMLESETEMVRRYGVARLTVREALGVLVNEGLLEKHHGKGTFCKASITQKKYRVDILLNLAEVDFIPYYLRSICAVLENESVNIVMGDTKNDTDVICSLLENAIADGTDAVIFQPSNLSYNAPEKLVSILDSFTQSKIPYIMIDTYYRNLPKSYVVMNEYQAGKIASGYFTQNGHKKLCVIGHSMRVDFDERLRGFVDGLDNVCTIEYDTMSDSLIKAVKNGVTGIFCLNDSVAKKCYDIFSSNGILIPQDVSIISVDDTVVASTLSPTLTSVIHPKENLGRAAAKAILSIISGEAEWPYKKVFEPTLAIRNSCKQAT